MREVAIFALAYAASGLVFVFATNLFSSQLSKADDLDNALTWPVRVVALLGQLCSGHRP
jgi:hypothetical protein